MTPEEKIIREMDRLREKRNRIDKELNIYWDTLKLICSHPKREIKEECEEGSYYNKAQYYTYSVCPICGDKKLIKHTVGSYA